MNKLKSNSKEISGENYECVFLDWDTDYFGVSSARVNLNGSIDKEVQDRIMDFCKEYDFVTIINSNNIKENNYWIGRRTNAFLVDVNIQFLKELKDKPNNKDYKTYVVNNYSSNDQIIDISRESFLYSRFFNDPRLPDLKAKNIYLQWTKSAFEQENKYFVISEREGLIAGYILFSLNKDEAVIELIAVKDKYQGLGVGKHLTDGMESFLMNKGINKIKVGTQVNNILANQFYVKMGFKYMSCGSVYHLWSKN